MEVELRHLRVFSAVARLRSFSGAARELSITQPALSRTVAQLETALGVRLLDRTSRQVELTEVGTEFLLHTERVLATFEQALEAARRRVTLRLGFSWLLPDPWGQRTVTAFEEATGVTVTLTRTDDPVDALQRRAVDVAVIRGDMAPQGPVRVVHLYDEARVAVCARQCPLSKRTRMDWAEVQQWPLVVNTVSGTTGPRSWPPDQRPRTIVETSNYDEWVETVAANRGIGVVPELAMRRTRHPALHFLTLTNAPPTAVCVVHLPDGPRTLIRQFVEAAVAAAPGAGARLTSSDTYST